MPTLLDSEDKKHPHNEKIIPSESDGPECAGEFIKRKCSITGVFIPVKLSIDDWLQPQIGNGQSDTQPDHTHECICFYRSLSGEYTHFKKCHPEEHEKQYIPNTEK